MGVRKGKGGRVPRWNSYERRVCIEPDCVRLAAERAGTKRKGCVK